MPTWPNSLNTEGELPRNFVRSSYQEEQPDNIFRDGFDAGPAQIKRRTTANPMLVSGRMIITTAQWGVLRDFFENDLAHGALSFSFPQQGVDDTTLNWSVRFRQPPARQPIAADYWTLSIDLEVLGTAAPTEVPFEGEALYWVDGLPFVGVGDNPEGSKYWIDGLPVPYIFTG
jgi:hypothetical protein